MALNQSQLESTVHRAFFNPQSNPNAVRPYSQEFFFKESDGCIRLLYFSEQYMSSRQPPQPSRWPSWPPTPAEVAATAVPSGAVAMAAFVAEEGCCHNCNCCCDAGFSLHIGNCSLCDSQKCHHEERYHPFIHSFSRWVGRSFGQSATSWNRKLRIAIHLQSMNGAESAPNHVMFLATHAAITPKTFLLQEIVLEIKLLDIRNCWTSMFWTSKANLHPTRSVSGVKVIFGLPKTIQKHAPDFLPRLASGVPVSWNVSKIAAQIFFLVWCPVFRCPEDYQKIALGPVVSQLLRSSIFLRQLSLKWFFEWNLDLEHLIN